MPPPRRPNRPRRPASPHAAKPVAPPIGRPEVTTLWDFPSQDYGGRQQGNKGYAGATPSYLIWNLLQRYTTPKDLVVDPFCGSGTTLDVARDLNRRALGYDVHPQRKDIFNRDARNLPDDLTGKVDLVFLDPPYADHLDYGDDPRDIGKLPATGGYYDAMAEVAAQIARVLRTGGHCGLYISDSYKHNKSGGTFHPLGFEVFDRFRTHLTPVDIISVVRHNRTLDMGNYRRAAEEGNYFLRGFNYLFLFRKDDARPAEAAAQAESAQPRPRSADTVAKTRPPRRSERSVRTHE